MNHVGKQVSIFSAKKNNLQGSSRHRNFFRYYFSISAAASLSRKDNLINKLDKVQYFDHQNQFYCVRIEFLFNNLPIYSTAFPDILSHCSSRYPTAVYFIKFCDSLKQIYQIGYEEIKVSVFKLNFEK